MKDAFSKLSIEQGDITAQEVDAIVNAANNSLLGGGGVDGAIHQAAGPELLNECRGLNGCGTGQAKLTKGYRLSAKWVIHTVGPIWRGGEQGEAELLADCYRNSLALADEGGLISLAFPSLSTGAYGYPLGRACDLALKSTAHYLATHPSSSIQRVIFVCFSEHDLQTYQRALQRMLQAE